MLIATDTRVFRLDPGPSPQPRVILQCEGVRRVAGRGELVAVAIDDGSLALLEDGQTRRIDTGVDEPIESLLILADSRSPTPDILLGTQGAHLHRLRQQTAERIAAFDALDCREQWHTPWGGPPAVRSLADSPDGWVYADIHVGSIMRSPDGGRTWRPAAGQLNQDVHQVATCPVEPRRVYANTARAFYVSEDHGQSWLHRADDLGCRYGRAVAVCPYDGDLALASVSDGPHGENVHGQLYRTPDAGRTWQHLADGFPPATARNIDTFHVAFTANGLAWAAVDDTLYLGRDRAERWETAWECDEPVRMLAPILD